MELALNYTLDLHQHARALGEMKQQLPDSAELQLTCKQYTVSSGHNQKSSMYGEWMELAPIHTRT